MLDTDKLLNELNAINKKREAGEMSSNEAEKMKFKLVREMDDDSKEVEFDNSFTA